MPKWSDCSDREQEHSVTQVHSSKGKGYHTNARVTEPKDWKDSQAQSVTVPYRSTDEGVHIAPEHANICY